jgi:hypothetical protein
MMKGSGPNDSNHHPSSVSSYFPLESNFDLLLSLISKYFVVQIRCDKLIGYIGYNFINLFIKLGIKLLHNMNLI